MSISDSELPNFGDTYLQYFNPERQKFELRRKSQTEGCLSISECMELIERVLRRHQLSFIPNRADKSLLLLPFAFIEPKVGDRILNNSTKEVLCKNIINAGYKIMLNTDLRLGSAVKLVV